jgi:hypothetical protein
MTQRLAGGGGGGAAAAATAKSMRSPFLAPLSGRYSTVQYSTV